MQRLLIVLTVVNVILFGYVVLQDRTAAVAAGTVVPVLRGRALEIVDDQGRTRATLTVIPADPKVLWKGKVYPETVLLRLISAKGRPNIKISASEEGGLIGLGGESDPTYAVLGSSGPATSLKLTNQDGHQRLIEP